MTHLKKTDREEIQILKDKGYSVRDIAKALEKSPSTISRELRRNSVNGEYIAKKASLKAYSRRKYCKLYLKKINENEELQKYIQEKLEKEQWSPDIIAGRWNKGHPEGPHISHVTLYKYLYSAFGQRYTEYLKSKRYRPKKRKKDGKKKREMIPNRISIEKRPKVIDKRKRLGDFEGDLIISKRYDKSVILSLIDRKSRFLIIRKLYNKKPSNVVKKLHRISNKYDMKSITFDNGIEFKHHYKLNGKNISTYFCNPYCSWEKGSVENVNKLIRQFIPKTKYIGDFSHQYIANVANKLNNRPRKCLKYCTPYEVFILKNNTPKCCV